jgi:hypothetical protein
VALLSSSKRRGSWLIATLALLALSLGACATVRPQDKEHLAEPSMAFSSGGATATHEQHVLDNREGASGGGTTRGGGCGCN